MGLLVCALALGVGGGLVAGAGVAVNGAGAASTSTTRGHDTSNRPDGNKYKDRNAKVREYWVTGKMTLSLGKGVKGGFGTTGEGCTNGNNGRPYTTTEDSETFDVSMLASESVVPLCFNKLSWSYWDVYVASPYSASIPVQLTENQLGGPYKFDCLRGIFRGLDCKQTGTLSVEITRCPKAYCSVRPPEAPPRGTGKPPPLTASTIPGRSALRDPGSAPGS